MAALSLLVAVPASLAVEFVLSSITTSAVAVTTLDDLGRGDLASLGVPVRTVPGAVVNAVTTTAVMMNGRKGSSRECMMVIEGSSQAGFGFPRQGPEDCTTSSNTATYDGRHHQIRLDSASLYKTRYGHKG